MNIQVDTHLIITNRCCKQRETERERVLYKTFRLEGDKINDKDYPIMLMFLIFQLLIYKINVPNVQLARPSQKLVSKFQTRKCIQKAKVLCSVLPF